MQGKKIRHRVNIRWIETRGKSKRSETPYWQAALCAVSHCEATLPTSPLMIRRHARSQWRCTTQVLDVLGGIKAGYAACTGTMCLFNHADIKRENKMSTSSSLSKFNTYSAIEPQSVCPEELCFQVIPEGWYSSTERSTVHFTQKIWQTCQLPEEQL